MGGEIVSAHEAGLIGCPVCSQVCRIPEGPVVGLWRCPRCCARLRPIGEKGGQALVWACLAAALLLYIPANILPMMKTISLVRTSEDTIAGGIVYFWVKGAEGLAAIIFLASIATPLLKLGALTYLSWVVRRGEAGNEKARQRGSLYALIEHVGRWSMLDVFVVALMLALVRFDALASVEARVGSAAFAGVVVVTMAAALVFDPRLLWRGPMRRGAAPCDGERPHATGSGPMRRGDERGDRA